MKTMVRPEEGNFRAKPPQISQARSFSRALGRSGTV
jgi:hypothetical protein